MNPPRHIRTARGLLLAVAFSIAAWSAILLAVISLAGCEWCPTGTPTLAPTVMVAPDGKRYFVESHGGPSCSFTVREVKP
jgi:hypothetical protein